jgi:hypothetical protein
MGKDFEYFYEKQIGVNPNDYFWNSMQDDERQDKWQEEQKKYGFDSRETWSLDFTFIAWIYPRLKMYQEISDCHPGAMSKEEWDLILNEMIEGFELCLKNYDENIDKLNKSMELFAKYLRELWW